MTYAGLKIGSETPIVNRIVSLKKQTKMFQRITDENPEFAKSLGSVRYQTTEEMEAEMQQQADDIERRVGCSQQSAH